MTKEPSCRHCGTTLDTTFIDLGSSPLANAFIPMDRTDVQEATYPLHARVCRSCWLVQVDDVVPAHEIFSSQYAYFSSFSESWLAHAKAYAEKMISERGLGPESLVVEIASNDGYLLQYFQKSDIPVLGIEPSANVARVAEEKGIPTIVDFFGEALARRLVEEGKRPDLIASANVLAHVPDINDFVCGVATLLSGDAVYTVEFPHVLNLIKDVQFDTIYHEHYSYLSMLSVEKILRAAGLRVFDVEPLSTHGGSLRVYVCLENAGHPQNDRVEEIRAMERTANLDTPQGYAGFSCRVENVRNGILDFLKTAKAEGKSVAAYGAAAKGNTFLNYCGIGPDLITMCVDRNPAKQGTLLPGSHIPVYPVEALEDKKPDYVLILPWNLKDEIIAQLSNLRERGTRFVIAVPETQVIT